MTDPTGTIVDAGVWIDVLNHRETERTAFVRRNSASGALLVADLVMMEVLRGIDDDLRHARARRALESFRQVEIGDRKTVLKAGENYRILRRKGFTIRSAVDCIVATYCIENGIELLHDDRDFDPFEELLGLRVVRT